MPIPAASIRPPIRRSPDPALLPSRATAAAPPFRPSQNPQIFPFSRPIDALAPPYAPIFPLSVARATPSKTMRRAVRASARSRKPGDARRRASPPRPAGRKQLVLRRLPKNSHFRVTDCDPARPAATAGAPGDKSRGRLPQLPVSDNVRPYPGRRPCLGAATEVRLSDGILIANGTEYRSCPEVENAAARRRRHCAGDE